MDSEQHDNVSRKGCDEPGDRPEYESYADIAYHAGNINKQRYKNNAFDVRLCAIGLFGPVYNESVRKPITFR